MKLLLRVIHNNRNLVVRPAPRIVAAQRPNGTGILRQKGSVVPFLRQDVGVKTKAVLIAQVIQMHIAGDKMQVRFIVHAPANRRRNEI